MDLDEMTALIREWEQIMGPPTRLHPQVRRDFALRGVAAILSDTEVTAAAAVGLRQKGLIGDADDRDDAAILALLAGGGLIVIRGSEGDGEDDSWVSEVEHLEPDQWHLERLTDEIRFQGSELASTRAWRIYDRSGAVPVKYLFNSTTVESEGGTLREAEGLARALAGSKGWHPTSALRDP